jgi:hypothetical protein
VPRNVVTLVPRSDILGRKRDARERVLAALGERYRFRTKETQFEIDFSKRRARHEVKAEVIAELERIDPNWRRLFRIYPRSGPG